MSSQPFSINYPLFALKQEANYVVYDLSNAQPKGTGFGIPVFTTEANLVQYLTHTRAAARVMRFAEAGIFRHFLCSIRDAGHIILFDLLPDDQGKLQSAQRYSAAALLEQFLPELGWAWSYPVYVLRVQHGFACVSVVHDGTPLKLLVVFTDWDLADRAEAAAEQAVAVPVPDREAFARLVRSLSSGVQGAAIDPPDPRRGGRAATAILLPQLLSRLEMEL